jgi:hypothetical protein
MRLYRLVEQGRRQMTGLSLRFGQMPAPSQLRHAISPKNIATDTKSEFQTQAAKTPCVQTTTGAPRLLFDKNFFTLL